MATPYTAPGVYIDEVQTAPTITGVSTSTAGFIGWCQTTAKTDEDKEAYLVTSFTEFRAKFGGFLEPSVSLLAYSVYAFFQQGGSQCYIVNINTSDSSGSTQTNTGNETDADATINNNGTKASYTFNAQFTATASEVGVAGNNIVLSYTSSVLAANLTVKNGNDSKTYNNASKDIDGLIKAVNGKSTLISIALAEGAKGSDPVTDFSATHLNNGTDKSDTPDTPDTPTPSSSITWAMLYAGLQQFDVIDDVNLILMPDLCLVDFTSDPDGLKTALTKTFEYCETRGDCFYIADVPSYYKDYNTPSQLQSFVDDMTLTSYRGFGAIYYPYLQISNPALYFPTLPGNGSPPTGPKTIYLPPSGAVAGAYAATDASVGVFKPAAGISDGHLSIALSEQIKVTQTDLGNLNTNGINDIRSFKGIGVCVWGARTPAGDSSEWKYLNVRRLFIFVEQSIKQSSNWIVFEPNTPKLWGTITRNVSAFLTTLWREGAFAGSSAQEAFFVKVDAENNPPAQRRNGELVIEIGIAPVFPAEFVIIRIGQKTLPAA